VYSSHLSEEENRKFNNHIENTIGINIKNYRIVSYENHNQYSLTELYNKSLNGTWDKETIFVFCHNDILFRTKDWGRILLNKFNFTDYDILGVAGSTYMAENGVWWTDRSKMYGIVDHSNGYEEWTSQYSVEKKGQISPVVLIDGLFMAVNPSNLEHYFDEEFKGFHHYDTSFCLPNYLDGCNIGVMYNIRILHKSIGETNEQWEESRKQLVEKYKDELPLKHISEDKLRVLICCQFFKNLTGSEMSNYELSKELVKLGCDVTVVSSLIGEPLLSKAQKAGVKVFGLGDAPNYGIGQDNKLVYLGNEAEYDIIHINHKPIGELILQMYPNTPAVMHVRSEVIPVYEEPIKHQVIKKYISIRDSVKEYIKSFDIKDEDIVHIDNPFDFERFNTNYVKEKNEKEVVLFVGTNDYLRRQMLLDLVVKTGEKNQELWLIGDDAGGYPKEIIEHDHVKYLGIKSNVEDYVKKCDFTAGIFMGRTTIEGFLCGKPAIIYDVDKEGNILGNKLHDVPSPSELEKYSSSFAAYKVFTLYNEVLER